MAEAGSIPRARLEQAQAELADAEDNSILRRTLYGTLRIEDFTKDQSDLMISAAQRLVDRQQERYRAHAKNWSPRDRRPSLACCDARRLQYRKKALDLANFRAKLVEELSEQAQAEGGLDEPGRYVSSRTARSSDLTAQASSAKSTLLRISSAFQRQFGKALPVSAKGDTALHRSLGFDHRGRVDIAVNPDQTEGAWLRSLSAEGKTSLLCLPRRRARKSDCSAHSSRPAQHALSRSRLIHGRRNLRVLISADKIADRVRELGAEIDADYPTGPIHLVGILKGAIMFHADLARAITRPVRLDFIGISSYGQGKTSSGEVRLTRDLDTSIEGMDVLIVEDIVDSGVTLSYLTQVLQQRKPKSVRIVTLLDKPDRRVRPVEVKYVGFRIPDEFVVGYGLDYAEDYRNLPDICVLEE